MKGRVDEWVGECGSEEGSVGACECGDEWVSLCTKMSRLICMKKREEVGG